MLNGSMHNIATHKMGSHRDLGLPEKVPGYENSGLAMWFLQQALGESHAGRASDIAMLERPP